MKKLLIADDHDIIRAGLIAMLEATPEFKVVGEVSDGISAVAAAERLRPDVLILDNHMPEMDGVEVARQVAGLRVGCEIVMLTMYGSKALVRRAFQAGIRAYVLKDNVRAEIIPALQAVEYGQLYLSPKLGDSDTLARLLARREANSSSEDLLARLTDRERLVFFGAVRGLTSSEIADQLTIGVRTVETHRKNMKAKLGVANQDKLLRLAIAKGLVELDQDGNIVGEGFEKFGGF